jgi:hypothetical protein
MSNAQIVRCSSNRNSRVSGRIGCIYHNVNHNQHTHRSQHVMKGNEIFPSKSLKAEDLNGSEPVVTIERVSTQSFDDGSRKPIIHFKGKEKTLVCNKTNWNAIVEITGEEDSDNWAGHRIKLTVVRVDFQGKRVPAIRVEPAPTSAPSAHTGRRDAAGIGMTRVSGRDYNEQIATADDESIPF